jgi:signal transduction histidine kinase
MSASGDAGREQPPISDERREAAAHRADALAAEQDPLRRAAVLAERARAAHESGRHPLAIDLFEQTLASLEEPLPHAFLGLRRRGPGPPPAPAAVAPGPAEIARLEIVCDALDGLAAACAAAGDAGRATLVRRHALARAASLGSHPRFAEALGRDCLALAAAGDGEAEAYRGALARLAEDAKTAGPLVPSIARRFEALALLEGGRAVAARELAAEARALAEKAGDLRARLGAALAGARIAVLLGMSREAAALADVARRHADALGDRAAANEADAAAGLAHVLSGEVLRGRRLLDRARSRAIESGRPEAERFATYLSAAAALATGDWRLARGLAERLGLDPGPSLSLAAPALLDAEATLASIDAGHEGRPALAESTRLVAEAADRAAKALALAKGRPWIAARARRIAGELAAERGDPAALALLEQALDESRAAGVPLETARALLAFGLHGARLERREPVALFREAQTIAGEVGAILVRDVATALIDAAEQARAAREEGRNLAAGAGAERRELASLLEVGRAVSSILELDPLLERIMDEVIALLGAERGFVMLFEEPLPLDAPLSAGRPLAVRVARNIEHERLSSAEFQVSRTVVAEVERSREPIFVSDASRDDRFQAKASVVGLGLRSILCFPLKTTRSFLGVLYVDSSSALHFFRSRDLDRTLPFVAQAAIAIENAFAYERIRVLYEETLSVARAREKVLGHLAHELKTPIAVARFALATLGRDAPARAKGALERGDRNLQRLLDIQKTIAEIYKAKHRAIEEDPPERIELGPLVEGALARARAAAAARELEIVLDAAPGLFVETARGPLETALASLLQNAIENTPDEGRIEVSCGPDGEGLATIAVRDYGVGITTENLKHVAEGFYHTQETGQYASKRPFDFDAGGKGLDLLRIRAFAERCGWDFAFESARCGFIPGEADRCPGRISRCAHCAARGDCLASGGSTFRITLATAAPARRASAGR